MYKLIYCASTRTYAQQQRHTDRSTYFKANLLTLQAATQVLYAACSCTATTTYLFGVEAYHKHSSMEAEDISRLGDDELKLTLAKNGVAIGPITSSTRPLFEKKLLRILNKVILSYICHYLHVSIF